MYPRLPRALAPLSLALLLAPAAQAQTIVVTGGGRVGTGRNHVAWGGTWTGRTRVVAGDACQTGRGRGQITLSTGRSGSPVVVVSGGRATCAPPPVVCPPVLVDRRVVVTRQRVDPWCDSPRGVQRTVNVFVGTGITTRQPVETCQPVFQPVPICPPARAQVVCQDPIPWAEPVAVPCPTDAPRGPADWTGRRRATQALPGPAALDPLDPDRDCLTPPPAELIADELLLALACQDLVKACRLARWLERGRERYARAVQLAFYGRTPSPTLLRQAVARLGRDCQDLPGRGSLLRLLGAEGSGSR